MSVRPNAFRKEVHTDQKLNVQNHLNQTKFLRSDFRRGACALRRQYSYLCTESTMVTSFLATVTMSSFFPTVTKVVTAAAPKAMAAVAFCTTAYTAKKGFDDRVLTVDNLRQSLNPIIEKWKSNDRYKSTDISLLQTPTLCLTADEIADIKDAFTPLVEILKKETSGKSFAYTVEYFCQANTLLKTALIDKLKGHKDLTTEEKNRCKAFFAKMSVEILTPLLVQKIIYRLPSVLHKATGEHLPFSAVETEHLIKELTKFTAKSGCGEEMTLPLAQLAFIHRMLTSNAALAIRNNLSHHISNVLRLVRATQSLDNMLKLIRNHPELDLKWSTFSLNKFVTTTFKALSDLQTVRKFFLGENLPTTLPNRKAEAGSSDSDSPKTTVQKAFERIANEDTNELVHDLAELNKSEYQITTKPTFENESMQIFLLGKIEAALEGFLKEDFYYFFELLEKKEQESLLKLLPQNLQRVLKNSSLWNTIGSSSINKNAVIKQIKQRKLARTV